MGCVQWVVWRKLWRVITWFHCSPTTSMTLMPQDDIITSKCLKITGPLWGEIHQYLVDSPHKGPVMQILNVSFVVSLNKLWGKQICYWWFKMTWSLYDITVIWRKFKLFLHDSTVLLLHLWRQCHIALSGAEWSSSPRHLLINMPGSSQNNNCHG